MVRDKQNAIPGKILLLGILGTLLAFVACTATTKSATSNDSSAQAEPVQKSKEELTQEMIIAFNLGYDRYQQEDYVNALPYLFKTNEIDRQINGDNLRYPRIYLQIGRSYFERSIIDSAYYAYSEGLEYNPGNLTFLNWLQWYYITENQIDEYIGITEEILKNETDLTVQKDHIDRLKELYKGRAEYEKALEMIELLLSFEPNNIALDDERIGLIRELRGDEALLEEFERRYLQDPTDTEVLWQLISAYSDQAKHDDVISLVDEYIALIPDDIDARLKKIEALRITSKFDDAINVIKELSVLKPQELQYLIDIADIYHVDKQNLRQALEWAVRARRLDRNYGPANYMIAELIIEHIDNTMSKYGRTAPSQDDKLVYEIAVTYFRDAAQDPNTRADAQRYVKFYGENFVRTSEDKFMNKGYDEPKIPEYAWIWNYKM